MDAADQDEAALAVGLEDRGLSLAHLEPVPAEGVEDVGLVRHQDHVGAALGDVGRRRHLAETQRLAGLAAR